MKNLILLAAVASNAVIGKNNTIPWNIPEEMELFKTITMGHSVIMGRKTYESIGQLLPGRKTIVLSRTLMPVSSQDLAIHTSIPEVLNKLEKGKTTFVIGGGEIYAQMMPLASQMRISHLKEAYEGDTWFPDIDKNLWKLHEQQEFPTFTHSTYTRI